MKQFFSEFTLFRICSRVQHRHHGEPGPQGGEGHRAEEDGGRSGAKLSICTTGVCCHENRQSGRHDSQGHRHGRGEQTARGLRLLSSSVSYLKVVLMFKPHRAAGDAEGGGGVWAGSDGQRGRLVPALHIWQHREAQRPRSHAGRVPAVRRSHAQGKTSCSVTLFLFQDLNSESRVFTVFS